MIRVEVVCALPYRQQVEEVALCPPVSIEQAIRATSLTKQYPQIDWEKIVVGVFGTKHPRDWILSDGDRVEIYRPLNMSPVETRRRRAKLNR